MADQTDSENESGAFYQRKLDRSPETEDFNRLGKEDKSLVSQLRYAMHGVRDKVDQLRDEAEDREREAARESALRKAAETRLDQLVDMYADPAVMEELKSRLPRAHSTDTRQAWLQELKELQARKNLNSDAGRGADSEQKPDGGSGSRKRSHSPPSSTSREAGVPEGWPYPHGPPGYPPPHGYYPIPPPQVIYMAAPPPGHSGPNAPGAPFIVHAPEATNQAAAPRSHDTADGAAASARDVTAQREQNRQISLLLAELDAARDLNKKLQARLGGSQQALELLKVTSQTTEARQQTEASGKVAAIVEEIYRAQRERDEAMMSRLRTANEERDEALLKLHNMETRLNPYDVPELDINPDSADTDLKNLLSDFNELDSDSQIDQQGRRLVDAINRQKQRKRQIHTEEMTAVLEERDRAVTKTQKQEGEILRLQRQIRGKTPEKQQQATLQAKLLTTQQERDLALGKVRKMEEELQTLRVYYSLHKSLSQEANLRDQFNNTLESYQGHLKHRDTVMDQAQKENNRLLAQLKAALMERALMEGELTKAQSNVKSLEDKNMKLEKVVGLLRERVKDMTVSPED